MTLLTENKQLCFVNESPGRSCGCSDITFIVFERLEFVVHKCGRASYGPQAAPPGTQQADNRISY